jgi:hypothetical protein
MKTRSLLAVDEQSLLKRLEFLFTWLASTTTEHELGLQRPFLRDFPVLLRLLVDDRVIL